MKKLIVFIAVLIMLCSPVMATDVIISVEGVARLRNTINPVPTGTPVTISIGYVDVDDISRTTPAQTPNTDELGFFSDEFTISNDKGPNEIHKLNVDVGGESVVSGHEFYPAGGGNIPFIVEEITVTNYLNSYFLDGFAGLLACRILEAQNPGTFGVPMNQIRFVANVNRNGVAWVTSGTTNGDAICGNAGNTCVKVIKFFIPQANTGESSSPDPGQIHWGFDSINQDCDDSIDYYHWVGPLFEHQQQNWFVGACCIP